MALQVSSVVDPEVSKEKNNACMHPHTYAMHSIHNIRSSL